MCASHLSKGLTERCYLGKIRDKYLFQPLILLSTRPLFVQRRLERGQSESLTTWLWPPLTSLKQRETGTSLKPKEVGDKRPPHKACGCQQETDILPHLFVLSNKACRLALVSRVRGTEERWWDNSAKWRRHETALLRVSWFLRTGWEGMWHMDEMGEVTVSLLGTTAGWNVGW